MRLLVLLLLGLAARASCSFVNPYPRFIRYRVNNNPGEALYLTPLIKEGKIDEALQRAKVSGGQYNNVVKSYAGYLTVNEEHNSNLFFWYFAPKTNASEPIVLWLQGGPGASSLFGLFKENGPFSVSADGKLVEREFAWNKNHHLIYIDNPVGTGFSFTQNDMGYARNEKDVGNDLHEAISQFFTLFPQMQQLDFWIAGESYAGKYVPALAYKIHLAKLRAERRRKAISVPIKLTGIIIGNGFSDPVHQLKYGDYLYQIGLLDAIGRDEFHRHEKVGMKCLKQRNFECALQEFDLLLNMDQNSQGSLLRNLTGYNTYFNFLKTEKAPDEPALGRFLQSTATRRAIHVGNNSFHDIQGENKVEDYLKNDVMDSVGPWIAELLSEYKVCLYNGQLDMMVPYTLTEHYLWKLKFRGADIYKQAPRDIWKVDDEIAGYVKEGTNLVDIFVRNAGHLAIIDQPKFIFDMITRLTHGKGRFIKSSPLR